MILNESMSDLIRNGVNFDRPISTEISGILFDGFLIKDGCYFFSRLLEKVVGVKLEDFQDRTGYECFVNSFHVEDYDDIDPVSQAIIFIAKVFEVWCGNYYSIDLRAIMSCDDLSVVVKFHVDREAEEWLAGSLEDYIDPVLSVDSSENIVALLKKYYD